MTTMQLEVYEAFRSLNVGDDKAPKAAAVLGKTGDDIAGLRYFFFPLILTGWMLIMLLREAPRNVGLAAVLIAGAYVPSFAAAFTFEPQVAKEAWINQVAACVTAEDSYPFDIQYGLPQISWSSQMKGDDCRKLEANAILDHRAPL